MNSYARVKIEEFTNIIDHRTNAHKRRLEALKGKSQIAIDMITRAVKVVYMQIIYLWIAGILNLCL